MVAPKARDTFGMGIGALMDTLAYFNLNSHVSLFPTVYVKAPDLTAVLKDVPGKTQLQVTQVLQDKADEDNRKIQAWFSMLEGHFKLVYPASADLPNVGSSR